MILFISKKRYIDIKRCLIDNVNRYNLDAGLYQDTLHTVNVDSLPTTDVSGKTYVKPDGSMWVYETYASSSPSIVGEWKCIKQGKNQPSSSLVLHYEKSYKFSSSIDKDYVLSLIDKGEVIINGVEGVISPIKLYGHDETDGIFIIDLPDGFETGGAVIYEPNTLFLMYSINKGMIGKMYSFQDTSIFNGMFNWQKGKWYSVSMNDSMQEVEPPSITLHESNAILENLQDIAPLFECETSALTELLVGHTYKFKEHPAIMRNVYLDIDNADYMEDGNEVLVTLQCKNNNFLRIEYHNQDTDANFLYEFFSPSQSSEWNINGMDYPKLKITQDLILAIENEGQYNIDVLLPWIECEVTE